jgi:hypothetical protein
MQGDASHSDELPLVKLTKRTDLAPRALTLLQGAFDVAGRYLTDTLSVALDAFHQHLLKLSEASRNNQQQQNFFLSARELLAARGTVAPIFLEFLEDAFATYDRRARAPETPASPAPAQFEALSLVESSELEESLTLQDFVARADVRHVQALTSLGHRFAVLVALPALESKNLPVGPLQIGKALRQAGAAVNIPAEHRLLLYRVLDFHAAKDLTPIYDAINAYFVEHHILNHLRATARRSPKPAAGRAGAPGAAQNEAETAEKATPPPENPAQQPPYEQQHRGPGTLGSAQPPTSSRAQAGQSDFAGESYPADPYDFSQVQSLADRRDLELFSTLRELLGGSRHGPNRSDQGRPRSGADGPGGSAEIGQSAADEGAPSTQDIQSILRGLQSRPAPPVAASGKQRSRSIAQIKYELLDALREQNPALEKPRLRGEDADTIDLLGMLFEHMSAELPAQSATQTLLGRLQVPLMRVALHDKSFFTRKAHPARQLLNAIAETGERWLDPSNGPADTELIGAMQSLLDRFNNDFDGDLGSIENLLNELASYEQGLIRKAEVAERRQVDAAIGREKLAVARETAAAAVAERIEATPPGPFVRNLLEQGWSDVLALTLLRHGESSPIYAKRVDIVQQLLAASAKAREDKRAEPIEPPEELRSEIESGLGQVGYHEQDIQAVVRQLFVPEDAANEDNPVEATALVQQLALKPRLGESKTDEKTNEVGSRKKFHPPLTAAELEFLDQLLALPFGTWFDFLINQQGDRVHKKMAWFSKLTHHCMFVNQRGNRSDEMLLEELAREMGKGQVMLTPQEEEDTFVDRAWNVIVTSLKRLGGLASTLAPPPAEPIA